MRFWLNIEFETKDALDTYIKEMDEFRAWKHKKVEKKENDGRGKKTHLLHKYAKAIVEERNIPYRVALKEAGIKLKEENMKL